MNEQISKLTPEEIETLITSCKELVSALPKRNPEGMPNLMLGHQKTLEILEWLLAKKFLD